jgi:hypothetical protein
LNKYSLYDLASGVQLFQLPNPLSLRNWEIGDPENIFIPTVQTSENFSVFSQPLVYSLWATLDPIFAKTILLIQNAEKLLSKESESTVIDDLQRLRQEAELLRTDYQKCEMNLLKEWRPSVIGVIPCKNDSRR